MLPIYLDNAASTPVVSDVTAVITACMQADFGNPSSAHHMGIAAEKHVKRARALLARAIGDPDARLGRIVWTSGGTESDSLGVMGAARARRRRGTRVLYSAIEHPAVRESARMLEREGFTAEVLPVDGTGVLDVERALDIVGDDTAVVAIMLVNNEIGTIQPVSALARALAERDRDIHLHCDAVQALGKLPIDVHTLGADSVAFAAHKLHGPKGVGALWVKNGARLSPLWGGGGQQDGLRAGTLNVPGIAGMGEAVRLATRDMDDHRARWTEFQDVLLTAARASGASVRVNGGSALRAPHVLSLAFAGVPAEPLLHVLESRGVLVSAGSACSERNRKPSPVLTAIGSKPDDGTIRFSFGRTTTRRDVDTAAEILTHAIRDL